MRIVCIGDSLTYGYKLKRSEVWTKLLEIKCGTEVLNKGINGDSSNGMLSRFYKDVVENSPTHVIIMGGTNDLTMDVPLSIVKSNIASMAHQANANGIIPIIGLQIQIEVEMSNKYWPDITDFSRVNKEIIKYREWVIKFGKTFKVPVIDFFAEFNKYTADENKSELYLDGLHPTFKGNEIITNIAFDVFKRKLL